jgi:DME family drug/metabolite transporter
MLLLRPGASPGLAGAVFVGLAAIIFGSSAAAVRVFFEQTGSSGAVVAFAQCVIAAPILLAAGAASREPWPSLREAAPAAFVTGGFVSGFLVSYFTAIGMVGVTIASVVAICSAPLFTAVLAVRFLRERPSRGMLTALALGVAGTALVLFARGGTAGGDGQLVAGVALSLLAGLCFGGENVAVRHLVRRFDPTRLAAFTTCAIVVLLAPIAFVHGGILDASIEGWPWLLYLAAFPTALAPALHNAGLRRLAAIPTSIVGLLEPLTAAGLGLLVFDEDIGLWGAAGSALLVAALAILYLTQRAREEDAGAVPVIVPSTSSSTGGFDRGTG